MLVKRMLIEVAERVAEEYNQNQVIVITYDKSNDLTHIVTYGKNIEDCKHAAGIGNTLQKALGWAGSLCNAVPSRVKLLQKEIKKKKNVKGGKK